ncbi:MAG: FAD:protein FMN transferase [Pseudomonadota bacterium]
MTGIKLAVVLLVALAAAPGAIAARVHEARPLMGTVVEMTAEGLDESALYAAAGAAWREMARLSDMMNHYDPASAVSALNDAAGLRAVAVPPELAEVLAMARAVSERTQGAFDVTIGALTGWRFRPGEARLPSAAEVAAQRSRVDYRKLKLDPAARTAFLAERGMRLDLGGIAKVYILRAGLRVLESRGTARAMVNGGGDVIAYGGGWRVGVRDPRAPQTLIGVLELDRGAVLSSGDYERYFEKDGRRYHHILDPRTGYPAEGPRGVTLFAKDTVAINGLTVAIMVLGKDAGVRLIAASPGVEGLIVDRDGAVWMSAGFRARLRAPSVR